MNLTTRTSLLTFGFLCVSTVLMHTNAEATLGVAAFRDVCDEVDDDGNPCGNCREQICDSYTDPSCTNEENWRDTGRTQVVSCSIGMVELSAIFLIGILVNRQRKKIYC